MECPLCKGKGKMKCQINAQDKTTYMDLTCYLCNGKKEISQERYQQHQSEKEMWCSCKETVFGSYPEDGQCNCGIHKHHVHCGTCGKVSQIG